MKKQYGEIIFLTAVLLVLPINLLTWTGTKRITWNAGTSEWAKIVADDPSGKFHLVWADDSPLNFEIYYKQSTDKGASWSPAKRLTWNAEISRYPVIDVDVFNQIHIAWENGSTNKEVYYKRSGNGGLTWSIPKRLTWTPSSTRSPFIISNSAGHIFIFWCDWTPPPYQYLYFRKSTDGGASWGSAKRLTWGNNKYSRDPIVAIDSSDTLHLVWHDWTATEFDIHYKKSTNGGTTWSATKRLTWTADSCMSPVIAVDANDHLHVIWADYKANAEIYYKKSTDGGTTWVGLKRLTWNPGLSQRHHISINASNDMHVVWDDNTTGIYEIYFKRSVDGGATWTSPARITWNSGASLAPASSIDTDGNFQLVWNDDTPGNDEIFHKALIYGVILEK